MEISNNIKILTNDAISINQLNLYGIKLGDSIEKINKEIINDDLSHETRWIHTDYGVNYRIGDDKEGTIIEFLLKKDNVEELNIKQEEDIIKTFGEPNEIGRSRGWIYYFYLQRKMVVSWYSNSNELWGIYLGENIIEPITYSAVEFIDKYLEFKSYVPNTDEWNEKALEENPPRYYRYKELISLMKVFEIGDNLLEDFQNTNFLKHRTTKDFEPIYQDIEALMVEENFENQRFKEQLVKLRERGRRNEMIFRKLMQFIEEIRNLLGFNSGWLQANSVSAIYTICKTNSVLNTIDQSQINQIKQLLGLVIDPKQRKLTFGELVKNYDFPDVDLKEIDTDWY